MALSQSLLPKTQFPSGYTVTVLDCKEADIIYGFLVSNTSPDLLPCKGRQEPVGCYIIEFAFPDFYKSIEQKKTDIGQLAKEPRSANVDAAEANPKLEAVKATIFNADNEQLAEEVKSTGSQEINPKREEIKPATSESPLINLIYSGTLVMFSVTLLIVRFGNVFKPVRVQDKHPAAIKESVQELASLGKFLFDVEGQRLLLGSEVISLTDKECKVLELLHKSFGELIPRETLMQKVWLNEGVITGRSLDMFVSKLRKKLSSDPELRITNVHGKGYRLENFLSLESANQHPEI
ncbi:winged helix-turn-helix domain-containing protein [Fulvivirgaceae bacterium PWU4]|uniref:Winged helix-turn-helix domain-containing protein n=1 Tax=Chryseosolibacter histidini TaxID=2782349 RepID=A0AAP2DQX8_9BACT|nr:winged helix-turn-helix domain-containing protein [Chryseosolibacter histidini]MBT1700863.1 winged helix-turn-helix domain-containing protein [Chryseosolibacter histidini]